MILTIACQKENKVELLSDHIFKNKSHISKHRGRRDFFNQNYKTQTIKIDIFDYIIFSYSNNTVNKGSGQMTEENYFQHRGNIKDNATQDVNRTSTH